MKPFVLNPWFDRLTMIGFFPNVLSESKDKLRANGIFISHLYTIMGVSQSMSRHGIWRQAKENAVTFRH